MCAYCAGDPGTSLLVTVCFLVAKVLFLVEVKRCEDTFEGQGMREASMVVAACFWMRRSYLGKVSGLPVEKLDSDFRQAMSCTAESDLPSVSVQRD